MINSKKKAREISSFDFSNWTKNKPEINTYTFQQKKKMINQLIKECCFMVGNLVFLQCIYILMGTDPALFWSNFFLHHCEAGFVFNLIRTEKTTAVKFDPIQDGSFWGCSWT